jgi:hypothetical protein
MMTVQITSTATVTVLILVSPRDVERMLSAMPPITRQSVSVLRDITEIQRRSAVSNLY